MVARFPLWKVTISGKAGRRKAQDLEPVVDEMEDRRAVLRTGRAASLPVIRGGPKQVPCRVRFSWRNSASCKFGDRVPDIGTQIDGTSSAA